jgi:hypothetical protein
VGVSTCAPALPRRVRRQRSARSLVHECRRHLPGARRRRRVCDADGGGAPYLAAAGVVRSRRGTRPENPPRCAARTSTRCGFSIVGRAGRLAVSWAARIISSPAVALRLVRCRRALQSPRGLPGAGAPRVVTKPGGPVLFAGGASGCAVRSQGAVTSSVTRRDEACAIVVSRSSGAAVERCEGVVCGLVGLWLGCVVVARVEEQDGDAAAVVVDPDVGLVSAPAAAPAVGFAGAAA